MTDTKVPALADVSRILIAPGLTNMNKAEDVHAVELGDTARWDDVQPKRGLVGDGVCQIYGKMHGRTNWLCLSQMIIAVVVEQMSSEKRHPERRPSCGTESQRRVNCKTEDLRIYDFQKC
jgi:hypothetical protein